MPSAKRFHSDRRFHALIRRVQMCWSLYSCDVCDGLALRLGECCWCDNETQDDVTLSPFPCDCAHDHTDNPAVAGYPIISLYHEVL